VTYIIILNVQFVIKEKKYIKETILVGKFNFFLILEFLFFFFFFLFIYFLFNFFFFLFFSLFFFFFFVLIKYYLLNCIFLYNLYRITCLYLVIYNIVKSRKDNNINKNIEKNYYCRFKEDICNYIDNNWEYFFPNKFRKYNYLYQKI